MRDNRFAYIRESREGHPFPLQNLLPPLPINVFQSWVDENQLGDHYLIDPISAHPLLPVILAQHGCRVLAARSNPINWLMSEVSCAENCREQIRTSVNKLLVQRKDGQALEDLIKPIYMTICAGCGREIQAEGFVWEKENRLPTSRVYSCPLCGDAGERDITDWDIKHLAQLGKLDIHLSRAMQKVTPEQTYEKRTIEEALACYPLRALYVCMLLVNRLTALEIEKDHRKFLQAALLTVFNDAHALRHWPIRDYRFLQFALPQRYFEKNLYTSLLHAEQGWPDTRTTIPISYWPNLPPENGGICFFQTSLAEKKPIFEKIHPVDVITVFPRPGQTYWTFSAIWAGWLWGKNAVKPIRSALRRRRYGWFWFARAINQSAQRIHFPASQKPRIFGVFPFYTPNLAYGLFAGMHSAGFLLKGAAFREERNILQAEWSFSGELKNDRTETFPISDTISHCLQGINEPLDFQNILMRIVIQTWLEKQTIKSVADIKDDAFSDLNEGVKSLVDKPGLLLSAAAVEPQNAKRFLFYKREGDLTPLSEKVEHWIKHLLQQSNEISMRSIDRLACMQFYGHRTPPEELTSIIVAAYADHEDEVISTYQLREKEISQVRETDMQEIAQLISGIGRTLGNITEGKEVLTWKDHKTQSVVYDFFISCSANLSDTLLASAIHENAQHVFVYPASRAGLIHYRLQHDFRLAEAMKEGWHLVKFRHIRRLAERESITLDAWQDLLDRDPPMREPPAQLQII